MSHIYSNSPCDGEMCSYNFYGRWYSKLLPSFLLVVIVQFIYNYVNPFYHQMATQHFPVQWTRYCSRPHCGSIGRKSGQFLFILRYLQPHNLLACMYQVQPQSSTNISSHFEISLENFCLLAGSVFISLTLHNVSQSSVRMGFQAVQILLSLCFIDRYK